MKNEIFTIGDYTNNGTIIKFIQENNDIRVYFKEKSANYHVSLKTLKKVNKEYTVLSFKAINGGEIYSCSGMNKESEYFSSPEYFTINSIRRESDGEVFTVGDLCNSKIKGVYKIVRFTIVEDTIAIVNDNDNIIFIDSWEKAKQKLFTTEDGVDIFYGDLYWGLDSKKYQVCFSVSADENSGRQDYMKYFSTKEKAEEYIIMNKPCLSINDIKLFVKRDSMLKTGFIHSQLKQLVKNKVGL